MVTLGEGWPTDQQPKGQKLAKREWTSRTKQVTVTLILIGLEWMTLLFFPTMLRLANSLLAFPSGPGLQTNLIIPNKNAQLFVNTLQHIRSR